MRRTAAWAGYWLLGPFVLGGPTWLLLAPLLALPPLYWWFGFDPNSPADLVVGLVVGHWLSGLVALACLHLSDRWSWRRRPGR